MIREQDLQAHINLAVAQALETDITADPLKIGRTLVTGKNLDLPPLDLADEEEWEAVISHLLDLLARKADIPELDLEAIKQTLILNNGSEGVERTFTTAHLITLWTSLSGPHLVTKQQVLESWNEIESQFPQGLDSQAVVLSLLVSLASAVLSGVIALALIRGDDVGGKEFVAVITFATLLITLFSISKSNAELFDQLSKIKEVLLQNYEEV